MSSVSADLEGWRLEVEEAFSRALDVYTTAIDLLANKLAEKYPKIVHALIDIVKKCCFIQSIEMDKKVKEIFERGAGGAVSDQDMINRYVFI
jgi:hypothetical protein